ncbi:tetratricopeptide repeat protein [Marivita sp.]|uniref:tetratricopeptide repeat protein n=1 Tax=Marivita sp. TaxID=2003365 RepID=UPI003A84F7EC
MRIGQLEFDPSRGSLTTAAGETTELSAQAAKLLSLLAAAKGETLSKDVLMDALWPDLTVSEDSLYQCVSEIRRLLGPEARDLIKTVPRKGYRLIPSDPGSTQPETPVLGAHLGNLRLGGRWQIAALSVAFAVALVAIALWVIVETRVPVATDKRPPSIAVLPFQPVDDDPRWARLGRGLGTDIANELARNDWLYVTAPLSARKTAEAPLDAAQDLGVRFVLNGSIQHTDDSVRISANLTDTDSSKILWSDRWSAPQDDLFDLQDQIIARIGASVAGQYSGAIRMLEKQQSRTKSTKSFTAYEHYIAAVELKHAFRAEDYPKAIDHLEQAVALDPDYAKAWMLLSLFQDWSADLVSEADGATLRQKSRAAGRRAFDLDPDDPDVLWKIAMTHAEFREMEAAQWALRRAIEVAPNNADILAIAGWISDNAGIVGEEPLIWVRRAFELHPKRPNWYQASLGVAAFQAGEYDLAVGAMSSAPPSHIDTQIYTAAAEALRGNLPQARAAATRLRDLAPDFTIVDHVFGTLEQLPHYSALFEGARLAGIPITPEDLARSRTPSIAVLPFENLSDDDRWTRLGQGLAIDIANELARTPRLYVTAPHSAERAPSDPRSAARDLNVRLIVSGTIRLEGGQVWLDARMTDATDGRILWSDTRVLPETGFLTVQRDFVAAIGAQLSSTFSGAITLTELTRAEGLRPGNLTAYDHYLIAQKVKHKFDTSDYPGAIAHLEKAVELDPGFAKAWALLSVMKGWMANVDDPSRADGYLAGKAAAGHRAFKEDPSDPDVLWTVSMVYAHEGRVDLARATLRRAVELGPNNADALLIAGWMSGIAGVSGPEPYDWALRAIALNPDAPPWYRIGLGVAAYHSGKDDVAVRVLLTAPDNWDKWIYLALAEYRRGNIVKAQEAAATLRAIAPNLTLESYEYSREVDRPDRTSFYSDARTLGIPVTREDLQLSATQTAADN